MINLAPPTSGRFFIFLARKILHIVVKTVNTKGDLDAERKTTG